MSQISYAVTLRNSNHSHPSYPVGMIMGTLSLDANGMVFHPQSDKLQPLVIHWHNLTSTYTQLILYPMEWVIWAWWLLALPILLTFVTFGVIAPKLAIVSVKFKDADFDKICVVEFCTDSVISFLGQSWATNLEQEMWELKRAYRRAKG